MSNEFIQNLVQIYSEFPQKFLTILSKFFPTLLEISQIFRKFFQNLHE